jgi:hypothetical protein
MNNIFIFLIRKPVILKCSVLDTQQRLENWHVDIPCQHVSTVDRKPWSESGPVSVSLVVDNVILEEIFL